MTVTKRTRFEVLRRDDHTCRYCRSTTGELTVDHVIPTALGGTDDPANLVAACKDCNAGKSSASLTDATVAQTATDALRWAQALHNAVDRALLVRDAEEAYLDIIDAHWWRCSTDDNDGYTEAPRPTHWEAGAVRWHSLGFPAVLVCDAIRVAMATRRIPAANKWRYTCGIVWNRITALQTEALAELAHDTPHSTGDQAATEAPRWDLYLQGYRHARTADRHYPTYFVQQLATVIDGPAPWSATPT